MPTGKSIGSAFKKYTSQPTGIWAAVSRILSLDSNRSSGIVLNPQYRNPPPGANKPEDYRDPVTIPAGDIADNPYWKRDIRRSYPQRSVISQGDVVGLLTVGNKANPKEDVLQIGEAGTKQLTEVKEEGEKGLPAFFAKDQNKMVDVLGPNGMPPLPKNMGQNMVDKKYEILKEQSYTSEYPCRSFG